ncbi:MAG: hypothetical protein B7X06_01005 [Verrucomicrobia bacterium 21-51-4]|nr:MAG: hypothetical protein B7X06_01005 [Verrucomicrobia bacterium 21-51-4]HQU08749.1 SMC-Scp complex subunit ScpB [Opitutales bacterium]
MSEATLNNLLHALLFSNAEALTLADIQRILARFQDEKTKFEQLELPSPEAAEAEDAQQMAETRLFIETWAAVIPHFPTAAMIREALEALEAQLEITDNPYRLQQTQAGYRLVVKRAYSEWIRWLRDDPKPVRLRGSVLETLAIIAYRPGVTRAEMEAIRGVSVDGPLMKLQELELITITGRADLPGRPSQYATTEKFLELVGLTSLGDLPASDVIAPQKLEAWLQERLEPAEEPAIAVGDAAMGLSEE